MKPRRWHNADEKIAEAAAEYRRMYRVSRVDRLMRALRRWWRSL